MLEIWHTRKRQANEEVKDERCRLSIQTSETKSEDEISMFKNRNKARMVEWQSHKKEDISKKSDCLVSHSKEFEFYSKCKGSH